MPFPDLTSWGMVGLEDSHYFSDAPIDPSIVYETDGGIFITRRRFTRVAGRHIVTGFTEISNTDKLLIDRLFTTNGGGAAFFVYNHPLTGEILNVRFESAYKATYTGVGIYKVWDVTEIKLRV